ncbi:MAG: hypothetical protein ACM3NQ_02355, partial [Bacteroidales bacterium]
MNARSRVVIALGVLIGVILVAAPKPTAEISVTSASPARTANGTTNPNVTVDASTCIAGCPDPS